MPSVRDVARRMSLTLHPLLNIADDGYRGRARFLSVEPKPFPRTTKGVSGNGHKISSIDSI